MPTSSIARADSSMTSSGSIVSCLPRRGTGRGTPRSYSAPYPPLWLLLRREVRADGLLPLDLRRARVLQEREVRRTGAHGPARVERDHSSAVRMAVAEETRRRDGVRGDVPGPGPDPRVGDGLGQ